MISSNQSPAPRRPLKRSRQQRDAQGALSAQQKQQVRQLLQGAIETKCFIANSGTTSVTTAGVIGNMTTGIVQGVGRTQRVGDRLAVTKLNFRYSIEVGATGLLAAADSYNSVRVIVFKWREDNGSYPPTTGNILQAIGVGIDQVYNFDDKRFYKILYDQTHVVFNTPLYNGAAVTWQNGPDAHYATPQTIVVKPPLGAVDFNIDGVSASGHLYYLFISDSAHTPDPTIDFTWSVEYNDA